MVDTLTQVKAFFFFSVLVMGAIGVFVVCIWKMIKLFALYKMETRIEELEANSKDENGKLPDLKDVFSQLSPREARTFRRLSYLAGFDRRKTSDYSSDSILTNKEDAAALSRKMISPKMRKWSSISTKLGNISVSFQPNHTHNNNSSAANKPSNNLPYCGAGAFDLTSSNVHPPSSHRLHALTPMPSILSLHKDTLEEISHKDTNDPSTPSSLSPNCQTSSSPTNIHSPVHMTHNPHCAVHGECESPRDFLLLPPPPAAGNKEVAVNTESNQLNSIVVPTVPLHPGYLCPCQLMLVKRTAVVESEPCFSSNNRLYRHMEESAENDEDDDDDEGTIEGDSDNPPKKGDNNSFAIKENMFHS